MAMISGSTTVIAALDTQQRLTYNPNAPRKVKKNLNPSSLVTPPSPTPATVVTTGTGVSVTELLKRPAVKEIVDEFDDTYLGYERWFPSPPKVEKPRSVFNAASLAFIGDSIYELYARRHFLFPPLSVEEYNDRVRAVVRCEAQYALLQKLIDDNFLTKEERDILRWGKNVGSVKTRSRRRAGVAIYNKASSLETLIGYLYLTNAKRLEEIMVKLGFSNGSSTEMIVEEAKRKLLGSEQPSFTLDGQGLK